MDFAAGVSVTRQRARMAVDPYSQRPVPADWTNPDLLVIESAFVASASSSPTGGELRQQIVTTKSLYCTPGADVRVGDRIVSGQHSYTVTALPEADTNPFTGWQPVQEIPLDEVLG
ncbi:hypothetical protein [Curtobacterium flaccumfaciens]|uniref:hypothetical protein n=1 Tax=Curtobacterium flaccumfaciens TaxID=2035 RepID=UPI00188C25DE|nr:hypothetical protein [Curtobacterium flaccumfaciens]MBF4628896.1 hypothetical protein [Curtobacterium flaccumfaciens]